MTHDQSYPEITSALRNLIGAAQEMPRETPAPGGASTLHRYELSAAAVWALDRAVKDASAALAQCGVLAQTKQESFGEAYMIARRQVPDRLAAEIVSRNAGDDENRFYRVEGESDPEFARRIVATYLAITSTDRVAKQSGCPHCNYPSGHSKHCPVSLGLALPSPNGDIP